MCSDGRRLDADLVVVAVGVIPDTALAAAVGLSVNDGIVVDVRGQSSHHCVYAAGDVTNHPNPLLGRRVRLESWQNAQNQAIAVSRAICGNAVPYTELPWFWSDQFDLNLQIAGLLRRWNHVVVRGDMLSANFSVFYVEGGRVVSVSTINRPHDMSFGRRLIEQRIPIDLVTIADGQTPLKKFMKQNATSS